ncbi:uncharacterized protein [Nicotiana tomentosiformis]|uniref:uncharacterized protein n=1 Tax=Nicotiana tomentosiformis TaxID=4098 RepID=UPI00388CEB33
MEEDEYNHIQSKDERNMYEEAYDEHSDDMEADDTCFMISTIKWNARGIKTKGAIERLKTLKQLHKLSLIAVLEPFLDDEQVLTMELQHTEAVEPFQITVIYAKCKIALGRPLWEVLRQKSMTCTIPWCVIGDFNMITSIEEKVGGLLYQMNKNQEFLSMIEDCCLVDLGFYGNRFT